LKISYFINQYPKVSHSFIRREILALERQGFKIQRISLRGWDEPLPDADDRMERDQTQYVLKHGLVPLVVPTIRAFMRSPIRFLRAFRLALKMGMETDRPLPYHLIYLAEACQVLSWMNAFGAERLHAHFGSNSAEVGMLAHALGGPPYSFTVHGPGDFEMPMGFEEKIKRANFVVAISAFGRGQLYARSRYADWPKIKVVRCGLESAFYGVAPTPIPIAPRLVCVGRLCEEKGQLLLIDAATRLADQGFDFELILAGDGLMRPALEAAIAERGISKQVRITGWISSDEVRNEILAARALVLASFAEGLPVVLMEAMALRRPVLTTYIAGIPELVQPGRHGWLFPSGSVDDLEFALKDCLSRSMEDLQAMGEAGRERVLELHSIDAEVTKLAEFFRTPAHP
jgi:glycosyltransferase involved in cell wall biosynthesis